MPNQIELNGNVFTAMPNITYTLEGIPGEFVSNKNAQGDPERNFYHSNGRTFTLTLNTELATQLASLGFPVCKSKNPPEGRDPKLYLPITLFERPNFKYQASVLVSDNGVKKKILTPDKWHEFDTSPIEHVSMDLRTYLTTKGNVRTTADIVVFTTKVSILRQQLADIIDDDLEPAPF